MRLLISHTAIDTARMRITDFCKFPFLKTKSNLNDDRHHSSIKIRRLIPNGSSSSLIKTDLHTTTVFFSRGKPRPINPIVTSFPVHNRFMITIAVTYSGPRRPRVPGLIFFVYYLLLSNCYGSDTNIIIFSIYAHV